MSSTMNGSDEVKTSPSLTLIAKFGKERIILSELDTGVTVGEVKELLKEKTNVLPIRQKLVGLVAQEGGTKGVHDGLPLSGLKLKGKSPTTVQFILMGTPEEQIFVDPSALDILPDVLDDFDLEFNAGSEQWLHHKANEDNLKKFSIETEIHIMNNPRQGKPLLVLDLDHTLLDFSSKAIMNSQDETGRMKRPHMDEFLAQCYQHFDLVVWSQTSWRWLETKLIELGMVTNANYKFCFVLDKTSMFTMVSTKKNGRSVKHHVKPLQIIWSRFADRWGSQNTVHIDDLARNFALNLGSGLKIKPYYRKKTQRDSELVALAKYLAQLAESGVNFDKVDFGQWEEVMRGEIELSETTKKD